MTATVHGYLVSTFTRTAVMACIEKGVEHELVPLAYRSPEHYAMHPFGRMPVFEHDGAIVFETLAIVDHIDAAFDGPALQPAAGADRTRMLQWIGLCSDYVYREVVLGLPRKRAATEEERATARVALERVDAMVRSPFLAGDALSLADLYLAPQISNAGEKVHEVLDGLDALRDWYAAIADRESFRRTAYDPAAL